MDSSALRSERPAFRGRRHDLVRKPDAGNPHVRFDERRRGNAAMTRTEAPAEAAGNGCSPRVCGRARHPPTLLFLLVRGPRRPQSTVRDDEERRCWLALGVVKPQSTDAMHRPVADLRQGRRRECNIMVEIQKYWMWTILAPDPRPGNNPGKDCPQAFHACARSKSARNRNPRKPENQTAETPSGNPGDNRISSTANRTGG